MIQDPSPYQVGGSLPTEATTYVVRPADHLLYNALLAGDYCYVLNARQMGKSSLRIRTMQRLQAQGFTCAEVELSGIGTHDMTASQWYGGIIQELISGFELQINRRHWLAEHDGLPPVQRLGYFIETVLLQQVQGRLVILIDEIDSVLGLNFSTADFFALIRHCYDKRASSPDYRRLSIAILGVATPSDLISDLYATPFNIGCAIDLTGFKFPEVSVLQPGLQAQAQNPQAVLQEILNWTDGQPFLTQKVCDLVAQSAEPRIMAGTEPERVAQLVRYRIIDGWKSKDEPEHLRTIRDRLLHSRSKLHLLDLYHKLLIQGYITATSQLEQLELRLSGIVLQEQGRIRVKNRIYEAVFDKAWVEGYLKPETQPPDLPWQTLVSVSVLITTMVMGIRALGVLQAWELWAFDSLQQSQPIEEPDPRLLIVAADEEDIRAEQYGYPLSDETLVRLVNTLMLHNPRVIGLDIVRDRPQPPGSEAFTSLVRQQTNLITICAMGPSPIRPPAVGINSQVGFVDLFNDVDFHKANYTIRRYLLSHNPAAEQDSCSTPYSLAFQLAARYLLAEGIPIAVEHNRWQLGSVILPQLRSDSGGYQTLDAGGDQLLMRYRNTSDPTQLAQTISLRDILDPGSDLNPEWIRDRVILLGVTAVSVPDVHDTPLGRMRGIHVHAHAVSHILSAVLDSDHSFWWWWPWWGEGIWILGWSAVGTSLFRYGSKPQWQVARLSAAVLVLWGGYWWIGLLYGGWIPVIPPTLSLISVTLSLMLCSNITSRRKQLLS